MPLVSIIVPVYNTQDYLPRCLDSILNQTFDDFELLVVDDGSTDSSPMIIDDYASKDHRVKAFHLKNGGVSRARNFGLENSIGDYVGFVDSDDYIHRSMYSVLVSAVLDNNVDIAQCLFSQRVSDEDWDDTNELFLGTSEIIDGFLTGIISNSVWSKLFSKKIVSDIRFSQDLVFAEDFEFVAKCLLRAQKVQVFSQPLYFYTIYRENSQTSNAINPKQIGGFRVYDVLAKQLEANGLPCDNVHRKELSESLRFLDSLIGHVDCHDGSISDLVSRIGKNLIHAKNNQFLSLGGVFRCYFVGSLPNVYVACVNLAKRMTGRLKNG